MLMHDSTLLGNALFFSPQVVFAWHKKNKEAESGMEKGSESRGLIRRQEKFAMVKN